MEYILGDVKNDDHGGILQIYFTIDGTKDWVSVCYNAGITGSVAHVACRQLGYVGAVRNYSTSQK